MPLYEYECQACGHRFEVIQKFSDAPPSECPKCGGAVEKLVSSPAIQFKGSGFYLTDYGRGGKSDTAPGQGARSESGEKADKVGQESTRREAAPSSEQSAATGRQEGRIVGGSSGESTGARRPATASRRPRPRPSPTSRAELQLRLEAALKSRATGVRPCSARYLRKGAARSGRRNAK